MANVAPRSKIMWAHWSCCLLFLAWTLMLLEWHFKQYVSLRHFYLRANTGVNFWRSLHLAAADGVGGFSFTLLSESRPRGVENYRAPSTAN